MNMNLYSMIPFRYIFLLLILSLEFYYPLNAAENIIFGIIKDARTGEIITNANIYLSNTTIGTSSNSNGQFIIANIPDGTYDLVVRMIGYDIKVISLNLSGGEYKEINAVLKEKVINLNEVIVSSPSPMEWKNLLKQFEKEFIGETSNSRQCRIRNPEVINLNYDKSTQIFTASSDSVIVIENESLGYLLHIVLLSYEVRSDPYMIRYKIFPRFEEIISVNEDEKENIKLNRKNTYDGSFRHFLTRIKEGNIEKELFRLTYGSMYELERKKGMYLPPEHIMVKIEIDDSSLISVSAPKYIGVEYFGNTGNQFSIMKINFTSFLLDKYCNLVDPFSVTCSGYWAKQRIADLLPDNYKIN